MKTENIERQEKLDEIASKQKILSDLGTWAVDNYPDHPVFNMLMKHIIDASEQIHKINIWLINPNSIVKPDNDII